MPVFSGEGNAARDFNDAEDENNTGTNFQGVTDDLELMNLSVEELTIEAQKRGVKITANDKAAIIDEIIAASVAPTVRAEVGQLISIATRDEAAKTLVRKIRAVQTENERAKKTYTLWLKNKEGTMYNMRNVIGCPLSEKSTPAVMRILAPLPDGSQNALIEEFKTKPENFETPLLVRLRRPNGDAENTFSWYVMLYLQKKQTKPLTEQTF